MKAKYDWYTLITKKANHDVDITSILVSYEVTDNLKRKTSSNTVLTLLEPAEKSKVNQNLHYRLH